MSALANPIDRLRELGGVVFLDGDRLRYRIPADNAEARRLLEEIRRNRDAIIAKLARPAVADQPAGCHHCEGSGECDCPACTLRRTGKPVPCLMCRPVDRQVWLAASRPETCWHCGGRGQCSCVACNPKEPCRTCGGSGKAGRIQ